MPQGCAPRPAPWFTITKSAAESVRAHEPAIHVVARMASRHRGAFAIADDLSRSYFLPLPQHLPAPLQKASLELFLKLHRVAVWSTTLEDATGPQFLAVPYVYAFTAATMTATLEQASRKAVADESPPPGWGCDHRLPPPI